MTCMSRAETGARSENVVVDISTDRASAPPDRLTGVAVSAVANLGGVALFLFGVQIVTGILLLAYYRPAADAASASMGIINDEVRFGWLVRSVHWWSSDLLILVGLLHLVRVYFSRGYAAPRQMAWVSGILLFIVILGFGFTGTLLPWDQYAYWSIDSSRETIVTIPLIGNILLALFWGGWEIGQEVLLRFYALHISILPWLALVCLSMHLGLLWRARRIESSALRPVSSRAARWFAAGMVDVFIAALLLCAGLLTLAIVFPPELAPPADPLSPLAHVQPRWYLLPARQLLRHLSGGVASLVTAALLALILLVPFIDRSAAPSSASRTVHWVLGAAAVAAWVFLALRQYMS